MYIYLENKLSIENDFLIKKACVREGGMGAWHPQIQRTSMWHPKNLNDWHPQFRIHNAGIISLDKTFLFMSYVFKCR